MNWRIKRGKITCECFTFERELFENGGAMMKKWWNFFPVSQSRPVSLPKSFFWSENFEFSHSTVFLNHWWNSKKKILVRELNEPLKCQICSGYLINPTVVNECQHTFCKTVSDWWGKEFPVNSNKDYPLTLVFSAFWTIMKTSLTVQFVALFLIRRLQKNL